MKYFQIALYIINIIAIWIAYKDDLKALKITATIGWLLAFLGNVL